MRARGLTIDIGCQMDGCTFVLSAQDRHRLRPEDAPFGWTPPGAATRVFMGSDNPVPDPLGLIEWCQADPTEFADLHHPERIEPWGRWRVIAEMLTGQPFHELGEVTFRRQPDAVEIARIN